MNFTNMTVIFENSYHQAGLDKGRQESQVLLFTNGSVFKARQLFKVMARIKAEFGNTHSTEGHTGNINITELAFNTFCINLTRLELTSVTHLVQIPRDCNKMRLAGSGLVKLKTASQTHTHYDVILGKQMPKM